MGVLVGRWPFHDRSDFFSQIALVVWPIRDIKRNFIFWDTDQQTDQTRTLAAGSDSHA